jgi:uncharacterized protein
VSAETDAPAVVVTGEATVRRTPDVAVVTLTVTSRDRQPGQARDTANRAASVILANLNRAGVAEKAIQSPSLVLQPVYDYGRGAPKLTGYEASRPMTIRITDVDLLGPVLDGLVDDGATQVQGTAMELADPEEPMRQALADAVAVARARAESLATAAGLALGGSIRIEQVGDGADPVRPLGMARMVADTEAASATQPSVGQVEVTAQVRVWFSVSA